MASYVGISPKDPTKYLGPYVSLVSIVTRNREPTGADLRQPTTGKYYPIGSLWIISKDPTTGTEGDIWYLSKIVANVAYWMEFDSGVADMIGIHTPDGTTVLPTAGIINFLNGTGMDITGSGSDITFNVTGAGFTWTDVTSSTQNIAVQNGYITDNAGGVTYTLPASAAIGDTFIIVGKLGITTITPNANQQLLVGLASGTIGVTGTVVGIAESNCITFRCITSGASTVWRADSNQGNWTVN